MTWISEYSLKISTLGLKSTKSMIWVDEAWITIRVDEGYNPKDNDMRLIMLVRSMGHCWCLNDIGSLTAHAWED